MFFRSPKQVMVLWLNRLSWEDFRWYFPNPQCQTVRGLHIWSTPSGQSSVFWKKKGKKLSYFLKQKIGVIQAKSLCVQKNFKKSGIFQYWTAKAPNFILEVNNITKFLLSSRAICYNSFFLDKKLMFYKEMKVFNPFLPNSELWPTRVGATCIPATIWHWGVGKYHLKSSQLKRFGHRTITSFEGSKKPFFFCLR